MKHYKKLLFLFSFLFLLFAQKIDAHQISFCNYQKETFILPVTIGVNVDAMSYMGVHPTINENYEIVVYNEDSCTKDFNIRSFSNDYYVSYDYYYYYDVNEKTHVDYELGKGIFETHDLTPPKITSFADTISVSNEIFYPLDMVSVNVYAFDDIDGNIIPEVIYDNYSDNYNILGDYSIIFKACDKSNNCSKLVIKMSVIDATKPVISGNKNFVSYLSNPTNLNTFILSLNANDNFYGDVSNTIYLKDTNYNPSVPGNYYAMYLAKDYSNNLSNPYKIEITVIDDIAPVIEGCNDYTSYLSNPLSTSYILSNLIISDNIDHNSYKNVYVISDNYTPSTSILGEYKIVVGAYDKYGNESTPYIIKIKVIDDVNPTIDGVKEYTSYLSSPLTLLSIKSNLVAYDNYDGNLFNKLEIIEDNYSTSKNKVGIYTIVFIVKDSSDNLSNPFIINIVSIDDIIPTIEGQNYYTTTIDKKLDLNTIKLSLNASDNLDGDLSNNIVLDSDSYSDNYNKIGTYFLSYYVLDSNSNMSNLFKIKIVVNDKPSYLSEFNNLTVYIETGNFKNDQEILDIIGLDNREYLSYSVRNNDYISSFDTVGKYEIVYDFECNDYHKESITVYVSTYPSENTNIMASKTIEEKEKNETLFAKIISFFKTLFLSIVSFMKSLFY